MQIVSAVYNVASGFTAYLYDSGKQLLCTDKQDSVRLGSVRLGLGLFLSRVLLVARFTNRVFGLTRFLESSRAEPHELLRFIVLERAYY